MEEFARSALRNTHCSAPEYRLKMLAEAAVAYSVRLLVDAEHTFYQPVRASDLLYLRRWGSNSNKNNRSVQCEQQIGAMWDCL